MTMSKFFLLSLAVAAAAPVSAQTQPWSLKACTDYALEHNISIKQRDLNRQQQEVEVNTARNSRLPDLNASASENFSFGRGLTAQNTYTNTNTSSTSFSLGTSVPLFTGFRIPRTLELNRLNLEAATADLEKARNDIRIQVAQSYVQILYSMELCDVARRQVEIDSLQVFRLREMQRNGKASGAEVAQQEAALAQSRLTVTQADNDYRLNVLSLTQLLELPSSEGFSIMRDEQVKVEGSAGAEIQAEQIRLQGAEKNIEIAKSALLPSLTLSGGVGSNYYKTSGFHSDSFGRQLSNNFSQYIGLSLSVPIFNRFATRNSIRTAQLNRENQRLQLENAKKTLYKEMQQASCNMSNSQAKYVSCEEALRSHQEAFNLMSAKYENGKANITEFNEAKNNLMKAESDLARAKYEHMYNRALLHYYQGKELTF